MSSILAFKIGCSGIVKSLSGICSILELPPNLNVKSFPLLPYFMDASFPLHSPKLSPRKLLEPPSPARMLIYCSPSIINVMGGAIIPI